jgi:PAS domain S-box-containing protein
MENKEVMLLKRALERQKKARLQAECILEEKSKELYDTTHHLKEANQRLETLLTKATAELDGVFINIIDPYLVMDMMGNVLKMNLAAKELLGYDHTKDVFNLTELIHKDSIEYTRESFKLLCETGVLKNYRPKIITKNGTEKFIQVNGSIIYDKNRVPMAAQGIIRDITQEDGIKQLLAAQRRQLDIIVENSPLGIVLQQDNTIIKANKALVVLLGYSEQELKKYALTDISVPEDTELAKDYAQRMQAGELESYSITRRYKRRDGTSLLAKTFVSAVKNAQGEVGSQVALIEDVTKEKLAEELLRASESRLATLIMNLQTGVLLEDEHGNVSLANEILCNMLGIDVPPEQLMGSDCSEMIDKYKHYLKSPKTFLKRMEKLLLERKVVMDDELDALDGRTFSRDYIPIFNKGIYKGSLWTYSDITLQKNYKQNLEVQKEKYSNIIANMNLGLVEVDNEDTILFVNQRFMDLSGYGEEELLGKPAAELLSMDNKGLIVEKNRQRLEKRSDSYEVTVKNKTAETRHWLISGAPNYDEKGRVIGSIGIHLDITDQKNLELQKEQLVRELERSNQGLQEYAHIVSHDLKSPLRSVSALASWLQEDYSDLLGEAGQYNLKMIQEKIESMDRLIGGILKYSAIGSETMDNSPVDMNEVVREVREIIYIPEHVHIAVGNTLPVIRADKTKVHQLIQNFLSNAVVNIEREKGLVEIGSRDIGTHWEFSIRDNGVGIPKEYHEKIFKIFQSIGNKERSTGIGLSIVKKIIDLYDGHVWLDSEIGKGTTFYFTLKK